MASTSTDFTRYQPPGVYTQAEPGPQLAVASTVPTAVGIFGSAVGYRTYTETLLINPDDEGEAAINRELTKSGIVRSTVTVSDPNTGEPYVLDRDYTIYRLTQGDDTLPDTRDDLYTIRRVVNTEELNTSILDEGKQVTVSYRYTDTEYYAPQTFYDWDDVRDYYGDAFDQNGYIQAELTLMSHFAMLNGAYQVVCVAVDPEDGEAGYAEALDRLRDEALVAIVVPGTGDASIHDLVLNHVTTQSNNRYERRAIVARDGTTSVVTSSQRVLNAQGIHSQRIAMVSPATVKYFVPELNKEVLLGGQYMAAALAGIAISNNPSEPLTRKRVLGFMDVGENMREGAKDFETQNGLMVVEKTRRQIVQVRHGVTTNFDDLLVREWSIVSQADAMVFRVRDYLENAGLIGRPILDTTLISVKASAESALQSLVRDKIIRGYKELKVRQLSTLPDVIEVKYEWRPAYPLNYIQVKYSVAVEDGTVTNTTSV